MTTHIPLPAFAPSGSDAAALQRGRVAIGGSAMTPKGAGWSAVDDVGTRIEAQAT